MNLLQRKPKKPIGGTKVSPEAPCCGVATPSRADQRRRHLLDVARRLFIAGGFHGTGIAQIACASGIKVGQIYRDFGSKEDIIAAIAMADLAHFLNEAGLERAIAAGDIAGIHDWVLSFVSPYERAEDYLLIPEIMAEAVRNPRIAQAHREMHDRIRQTMMAALAAYAPGETRESVRADLAGFILTLSAGLCQWIALEMRAGQAADPPYGRFAGIVSRELAEFRKAQGAAAPPGPSGEDA